MGYIINHIGQTKVFFHWLICCFRLFFFFKETGVCHQSSEFSLRGAGKENRLLF